MQENDDFSARTVNFHFCGSSWKFLENPWNSWKIFKNPLYLRNFFILPVNSWLKILENIFEKSVKKVLKIDDLTAKSVKMWLFNTFLTILKKISENFGDFSWFFMIFRARIPWVFNAFFSFLPKNGIWWFICGSSWKKHLKIP
jgi:hypothetical protein